MTETPTAAEVKDNGRAWVPQRIEASATLPDGRVVPCLVERMPPAGLRLNLGSGNTHLDGYTNVDRKVGTEVYPLPYPDGSVEEILASHVLEHFGHREVGTVLGHWVAKLRPGGKIRLAVPDFEAVVEAYQAGAPISVQGHVMGGHVDDNDHHGTIFDVESLTELMLTVGLERIGPWVSDIAGCSRSELSLNLQGFKPISPCRKVEGVRACMSVPRFGPLMHPQCYQKAFMQLGIDGSAGQSCFWHQKLSQQIEQAIADPGCRYVLTMDYDTIFCAADVLELYRLMEALPDLDALFPLQSKRGCEQALFSVPGQGGRIKTAISQADLARHVLPAYTGHFGLTLLRADTLRKHSRPWMTGRPADDGRWEGPGQLDPDIDFWKRWREAGFSAALAPRVVVGHLEEVIAWPAEDLRKVYQNPGDYDRHGIPAEVKR